ncbi:MAG TPA: AAA domain-containing protein, partial [Burkholderiaceae bacterium]|nr:AAA domain-containing protein [Burkholderiaceae bacterium]
RKGVRDQYLLEAGGTEAEVNPALRQQLRQSHGIELPERVDLATGTLHELHAWLSAQIATSEPGVQLRWLDQPEIDLIHQRAVQRLEQFKRRQRVPAPAAAPAAPTALTYSYRHDDFRPLGLQLFRECVSPSPLPLRGTVGARPGPRHPQMAATLPPPPAATAADTQIEPATDALRESAGNPYQWDFDLSAVTLGNFDYRKMSLVRDYVALIDDDQPNPAFERVFSVEPRPTETPQPAPLPRADCWTVLPADATQTAAVALARSGTSCIIQGPPGTGKSQTITNLIADHVGRGRRVLFVCEKRAAIDVVFHRLRQLGLDELCCMIHDPQADKKAFVEDLRQTYGQWLAAPDMLDDIQRQRQAVLGALEQDLQALQRFDAVMRSTPPHVGLPVRELVARLAAVRTHEPTLTPREAETLPEHAVWLRHAGLARRLHQALLEHTGQGLLSAHPLAALGPAVLRHERPLNRMAGLIERAEQLLQGCSEVLATALPAHAQDARLGELLALADHARRLHSLAALNPHDLLDPHSEPSRQWDIALAQWEVRTQTLAKCAQLTLNWRDKLPAAEAQAALVQARQQELGLLRWLRPSWWRLHGELQRRYDFTRHATPPPLSRVLTDLISEHRAQAACGEIQEQLRVRHGCTDVPAFASALQALREDTTRQPLIAELHGQGLAAPPDLDTRQRTLAQLAAIEREALALAEVLGELLIDAQAHTLQSLAHQVQALGQAADALPALLPLLQELADADPGVAQQLRSTSWPPDALEAAIARAALERVVRSEPGMAGFDADALARHAQRLAESERELMQVNAQGVRAAVRRRFADQVRRSSLPVGQLDGAGKQFKKTYGAGRRELEHEFGKTLRDKSIRELASGDSGRVVRDIKPIWLMSPLSVSDTLPLEADLFDVVIFDEASQIPVEEAVPALVRAPQVIVVGDEMQLPPTRFFAHAREDGDDEAVQAEEDGGRLAVMLDADSLLNQCARNLPATSLAWHYRSRSESLIGYSNAAFYAGLLHTVPDRRLPAPGLGEIHVTGAEGLAAQADALLARPISVHLVAGAVYAQRRNEAEARHIAGLVRELLARETGQSLGIVAFSQAQQAEIEAAIDTLAEQDPAFAARLEAESQREHEDQFVGLFVKNLEDVQGDERDIVILSVCYGPGPDGRMRMNFGPINQRGGEKRLNVIFSRARQHMAVVTSIRHEAITNDHNDGAATLKQFLRYAEHLSRGESEAAQRVLDSLHPAARRSLAHEPAARDVVRRQLAQALRERGHAVDECVGQSRFRCDLGIRAADGGHYALGILLDGTGTEADVFERHVSRPRILAGFGWRCVLVQGRDWVEDPARVVAWVERALGAGDPEAG